MTITKHEPTTAPALNIMARIVVDTSVVKHGGKPMPLARASLHKLRPIYLRLDTIAFAIMYAA